MSPKTDYDYISDKSVYVDQLNELATLAIVFVVLISVAFVAWLAAFLGML